MRRLWSKGENACCVHPGASGVLGYDDVMESWELVWMNYDFPLEIELKNVRVHFRGDVGYITSLAWSLLGRPVGVVGERSLLPMCLRGLMVSGLSAFTMLPQLTFSRLFTLWEGGEIKEEQEDGWYHVERSSGRNHQRLRLPESADPKRMEAGMEDGVLTVTIQKKSSGFVNVS
ncbi:17.4 kDa class I heat shock protein [Linum grandiflorum]